MSNSPAVLPALDPTARDRLLGVARRLRMLVVAEGVAWVVTFLFVAVLIQFALDYGSHGLQWSMRAAMLSVVVAGAIAVFWRFVIGPLSLQWGVVEVAHLVERRYPQLNSALVSAVRFSAGQCGPADVNSPELAASVVRKTATQVAGLDFDVVLDPRRARWAGSAMIAVAAIAVLLAVAAPQLTSLWFARNVLLQNKPWPKRTTLIVEADGRVLVGAKGDDLVVSARAEGVQPREVEILFETAGGQRGRQTMVTVGSEGSYRYRYSFEKAQENFTFHLRGGDDRTDIFEAQLLERPRVTSTEMRVVPPSYSRLELQTLGNGQRAVQVLKGSQVTLRVWTNHPVARATVMVGDKPLSDAVGDGEGYSATVSPVETRTYSFRLVDQAGLENREQVRLSVQVRKDDPPRVRLKLTGVGEMVTPEAVLPMEVDFEDEFGLSTAQMIFQLDREGSEEQIQLPPGFRPGLSTLSASVNWPVATIGAVPGERITVLARASDFDDVSGPNSSRSQEFSLRVVTREELLAELARREREFRADFERLVDAQEQLRGRLLTVLGRFGEKEAISALRDAILSQERTQRNLAGSVNVVRQQFERILGELQVNGLDTTETRERIGLGIIDPLAQLVRRELVVAADTIGQWSAGGSSELATRIDPQQIEIIAQMRAILAKMVYREGYQEVVNMLREIIRLQKDLNAESKKALKDQAHELFDEKP